MLKKVQNELLNLELGIHFCEILSKGNRYDDCEKNMTAVYDTATKRLARLIHLYGWPGNSLVGEDGSHAAYIIARGAAHNPVLMRSFSYALSEAVRRGDASKIHEAGLSDLIRYYEGKPQLLGMYFDWKKDGQLGAEVVDIHHANKCRKALGLESLQEATNDQQRINRHKEPPDNFKHYLQQIDTWANETGWRQRHAA